MRDHSFSKIFLEVQSATKRLNIFPKRKRWCGIQFTSDILMSGDERGQGYCLLSCEGLEGQFGHLKWLSSICAWRPLWVISHFITCCQSQSTFLWARVHRWGKATKRGRYAGWLGRPAAQRASCYLTEAESQSRCGRDLYTADCSGICSRHQHRVTDCFSMTPGGLKISSNSKGTVKTEWAIA